MPKAKHIHLSVVLSSILVLSGCSALSFLNIDAVDDNINYSKKADSVRALAIPPGLSSPNFDRTYASAQNGASVRSSSIVNQSQEPVQQLPVQQARPVPSTPVTRVGSAPVTPSDSGSSLGAALMAQSEAGDQVQAAPARVSEPVQSRPTQVQVSDSRSSSLPQVAMIRLKGGEPALAVNAPYAAAWKVLAPLLPKVGFNITKQQPNQGIFTTTYGGQSGNGLQAGKQYLILLAENASKQSFIGVADANGKPANEATAQRVLRLLRTEFEK